MTVIEFAKQFQCCTSYLITLRGVTRRCAVSRLKIRQSSQLSLLNNRHPDRVEKSQGRPNVTV
jgi:hypothetical protein